MAVNFAVLLICIRIFFFNCCSKLCGITYLHRNISFSMVLLVLQITICTSNLCWKYIKDRAYNKGNILQLNVLHREEQLFRVGIGNSISNSCLINTINAMFIDKYNLCITLIDLKTTRFWTNKLLLETVNLSIRTHKSWTDGRPPFSYSINV